MSYFARLYFTAIHNNKKLFHSTYIFKVISWDIFFPNTALVQQNYLCLIVSYTQADKLCTLFNIMKQLREGPTTSFKQPTKSKVFGNRAPLFKLQHLISFWCIKFLSHALLHNSITNGCLGIISLFNYFEYVYLKK